MRPPLPPGPYLVVGLARSGRAAALALRARGAEVTGTDGGAVDASAAGELERAGVASTPRPTGSTCSRASRRSIKSPGVPQEAAVVRAARERGVVGARRARARLAAAAERRDRDHRLEREDDDDVS